LEIPFPSGPRQPGQWPADAEPAKARKQATDGQMMKQARMTKSEQRRERLRFFISVEVVASGLPASQHHHENLTEGNEGNEEKRQDWTGTEPAPSASSRVVQSLLAIASLRRIQCDKMFDTKALLRLPIAPDRNIDTL